MPFFKNQKTMNKGKSLKIVGLCICLVITIFSYTSFAIELATGSNYWILFALLVFMIVGLLSLIVGIISDYSEHAPSAERGYKKSIFLIEKGWIDQMENKNADGYRDFGYKLSEKEARMFCESKGYWTPNDCWSIEYRPHKKMAKYRYKEIKYCN